MHTTRQLFSAALSALLVLLAVLAGEPSASATTASADSTRPPTRHYIANLDGATSPRRLGYDVFDAGASRSALAHLPRHVQGLVWLGQKCPTPADARFRATVRRLADNPKVFGYYLSDEPHVRDCPHGPAALATRTDFIHRISGGRQRSFIVINQSSSDWAAGYRDTRAFRPGVTGVDLVGIDSYPCSTSGCDFSKIAYKVRLARRGGVPLRDVVPVYQAFGQGGISGGYYTMPTPKQTRRMLAAWHAVVPHPVMDYTYGWSHQDSARPTLVDRPRVQAVFAQRFAG